MFSRSRKGMPALLTLVTEPGLMWLTRRHKTSPECKAFQKSPVTFAPVMSSTHFAACSSAFSSYFATALASNSTSRPYLGRRSRLSRRLLGARLCGGVQLLGAGCDLVRAVAGCFEVGVLSGDLSKANASQTRPIARAGTSRLPPGKLRLGQKGEFRAASSAVAAVVMRAPPTASASRSGVACTLASEEVPTAALPTACGAGICGGKPASSTGTAIEDGFARTSSTSTGMVGSETVAAGLQRASKEAGE
mmetsp:Transcript_72492/g.167934  ORF Transcript_72492/g.167934 Transcript_72492/m.167934 type:complete len:249 (-) Transcript_72492:589-1335(-)